MKHSCELGNQQVKILRSRFPLLHTQKLAFVAENEGCFKSPNSCPRLLGSVMVLLNAVPYSHPNITGKVKQCWVNTLKKMRGDVLHLDMTIYDLIFLSFSHRSVTAIPLQKQLPYYRPTTCFAFVVWIVFGFLFCFKRSSKGSLTYLFWSCSSIMFMCLPTIKLQKRRTWVERSWMHHKFCLLMISAKTSLTSSLRSIASMLFVVASSLAALNRLSFESASFLLLAWIISNEKSAVQPGK